jgi:hypothetical protein
LITRFNNISSMDGTNWVVSLVVVSSLQFAVNATPVAPVLFSEPTGGGLGFSFSTIADWHYTVECKTNLADASWTFFSEFTGNGSFQSVPVPATNGAQFFRVSTP